LVTAVGVDDAVVFGEPDDLNDDPDDDLDGDPDGDPDGDDPEDAGKTVLAAPLASAAAAAVSGADPPQATTRNPNATTYAQFFTSASLGTSFRPRPQYRWTRFRRHRPKTERKNAAFRRLGP
jgi:hypothetical protein